MSRPKHNLTMDQQKTFNDVLLEGVEKRDHDMMRLALENGANPNLLLFASFTYKPSFWTNYSDEPLELAKMAFEFGADPGAKKKGRGDLDFSAIHWAYSAEEFRPAIIDLLIEKGALVDEKSPEGYTVLMWAVTSDKKKRKEIVEYLLSKGANPLETEPKGNFPLRMLKEGKAFSKEDKAGLIKLMMKSTKKEEEKEEPQPSAAPVTLALEEPLELPEPLKLIKKPELKHGGIKL